MIEKHNDATRNRPEGDRTIDAPVVCINLEMYRQQVKSEAAWQKNDRNAITVFKTANMTIVVAALKKNAVIQPPTPEGMLSVQVLEGSVMVQSQGATTELGAKMIAGIHADTEYSITAAEESVLLLTMTK